MPLPTPDSYSAPPPKEKKKSGLRFNPAATLDSSQVAQSPPTYGPPLPGSDLRTQYSPAAVEWLFGELSQAPLPTQGAVADLVDKTSTYPEEEKANLAEIAFRQKAEAKAERKAERLFKVTPPTDDELLLEYMHSPQGTMGGPTPPVEDLRARWMAENEPNDDALLRRIYEDSVVNRMVSRRERVNLLQGDRPEEKDEPGKREPVHGEVTRMTAAEYEALDPRAKAAVDFNTALVQAVRKDKRLFRHDKYDPTEEEQSSYKDAVQDLFGEGRGSKVYAPETVALLNQLKLPDQNADLDDFLKLKVAVTQEQLKFLDDRMPRPTVEPPGAETGLPIPEVPLSENVAQTEFPGLSITEEQRLAMAQKLVDSTLNFQQHLEDSGAMIQTFLASARNSRDLFVGTFGGVENAVEPDFGFRPLGPGELDEHGYPLTDNAYIQTTYQQLANASNNADAILANLRQNVPHLEQELYHYIDVQTRSVGSGDEPLFGSKGSRTAGELRKILGLGR